MRRRGARAEEWIEVRQRRRHAIRRGDRRLLPHLGIRETLPAVVEINRHRPERREVLRLREFIVGIRPHSVAAARAAVADDGRHAEREIRAADAAGRVGRVAKMLRRAGSCRGPGDDDLVGAVAAVGIGVEVRDLHRHAGHEVVVDARKTGQVISVFIEDEHVVIRGDFRRVEEVVPLEIELRRGSAHDELLCDVRPRAGREIVKAAAGQIHGHIGEKEVVHARLAGAPVSVGDGRKIRFVAERAAIARSAVVERFFSREHRAVHHVLDGLSDHAVGEKRFVGKADVVHDHVAISHLAQLANALGKRRLRGARGVKGERAVGRDVVDDLQHRAAFIRVVVGGIAVLHDIHRRGVFGAIGEAGEIVAQHIRRGVRSREIVAVREHADGDARAGDVAALHHIHFHRRQALARLRARAPPRTMHEHDGLHAGQLRHRRGLPDREVRAHDAMRRGEALACGKRRGHFRAERGERSADVIFRRRAIEINVHHHAADRVGLRAPPGRLQALLHRGAAALGREIRGLRRVPRGELAQAAAEIRGHRRDIIDGASGGAGKQQRTETKTEKEGGRFCVHEFVRQEATGEPREFANRSSRQASGK